MAGAIDRYDPDPARGSFRGWLFRIARNLMINLLSRPPHSTSGDWRFGRSRDAGTRAGADGAETALFDLEYRRRIFLWAADQVHGEFRKSTWQAFWLTAVEGQDSVRRRRRAASRSGRSTSPAAA